MYQNEKVNCVKYFSELTLSDELKQVQKDFVKATQYIQTTNYIWDCMMFHYLVNDIKYFASIHLITDEEVTNLQLSLIRIFSINSITSRDKDMCKSMKEWVRRSGSSRL